MNTRQLSSLLGALALAISFQAGAATISLQPSSDVVLQSAAFTVDLMLNAPDAPGNHPGAILGEVVIDFDPTLISYDGFALADGPLFLPNGEPSVGSANGRQTVTLGFRQAIDVGRVGTYTFTAVGAPESIASIGLDDPSIFGSFFSTTPTIQPFFPDLAGTSIGISAIPLPASAWLFATAFGIAGFRMRRVARTLRALR